VDNGPIFLLARTDSPNVCVGAARSPATLVAGVGSVPSNRVASSIRGRTRIAITSDRLHQSRQKSLNRGAPRRLAAPQRPRGNRHVEGKLRLAGAVTAAGRGISARGIAENTLAAAFTVQLDLRAEMAGECAGRKRP
jgi:hypothetical protein